MGRSRKKRADSLEQRQEKKLRRMGLLLFGLALLIGLVLVLVLAGAGSQSHRREPQLAASPQDLETAGEESGGTEASLEELVLEPDNQEYHYDFGTSILTQDGEPEIQQLMEQYFRSISDCDMETFQQLFVSRDTSMEEAFRQQFEQQRQYIEGYQNISCYTVSGQREKEMAAYVYYEIRYTGVETAAPGLVRIYAVKGEDGVYRIEDREMPEEVTAYLEQLAGNEDVRLLSLQVDQKLEQAMAQDPALRERIAFLKQGASYMQEPQE